MEPVTRNIVLRHLNGAKANRLDQFAIVEGLSLQIGRKPGSDVLYGSDGDDLVSRQHATITLRNLEGPNVFLADTGSSNGTFLNGEQVTAEREIFPDDVIELGKGGPKFVFDIQPRPEGYASRTRVMNVVDAAATRIMSVPSAPPEATAAALPVAVPPKQSVGKETVERLLYEERRSTRKSWSAVAAGLVAFILVGGGALYWYSAQNAQKLRTEAAEAAQAQAQMQAEEVAKAKQEAIASVARELGTSSRQIIETYGDATVRITLKWGLYDREAGKPLFVKMVAYNKRYYPAFVRLRNGDIVPWLTLDDGARNNFRVGLGGSGSGFVVSENGFILTNKHVAAGWMTKFRWPYREALVYKEARARNVGPGDPELAAIGNYEWIPEQEAGVVFLDKIPFRISDDGRNLIGRNEELEVRFPGSRLGMAATLVRASTDADAALIKVDTPQSLNKVQIAADDKLVVGDRVTVLGYPAVSMEDRVVVSTLEAGRRGTREELVPQPTVTEGIISRVAASTADTKDNIKAYSDIGDAFQLAINTTGAGNSGGPVFDSSGRVIGFFTYGLALGNAAVSFAVPIKYGVALLQAQRAP